MSSPTAKLTASDGAAGDNFGTSVAISGNTVVVGASGTASTPGRAYIYTEPGTGWANMNSTAELTASDGARGDSFGKSVAISGSTVLVGAEFPRSAQHPARGRPTCSPEPNARLGRACIYMASLPRTARGGTSYFVRSGSMAARWWLAALATIGANINQGSVYLYGARFRLDEHEPGRRARPPPRVPGDDFGLSVAINGSTVVVGQEAVNGYEGAA